MAYLEFSDGSRRKQTRSASQNFMAGYDFIDGELIVPRQNAPSQSVFDTGKILSKMSGTAIFVKAYDKYSVNLLDNAG